MESKHTKAPWQVTHYGDDEIVVISGDQKTHICRINQGMAASDFPHVREEAEANAKLCGASPELLEALKLMIQDYWADYPEKDREAFRKSNPDSNIVKAEQAINKATI